MDKVRQFGKDTLSITEEDVINYIKRNRPRVISHAVVFVLQFLVVWFFMTGPNWEGRYGATKLWLLFLIILSMTALEMVRYSDLPLNKFLGTKS